MRRGGPRRDRRYRRRWPRNVPWASTAWAASASSRSGTTSDATTSTASSSTSGRPVGTSLESVVQYLSKDSTYGPLHRFLFGRSGVRDMQRGRRGDAASSAPTARRSSSCARRATPRTSRGATTASPWWWMHRHVPRPARRGRRAARARCAATWPPARAVVVQSSPFKSKQKGVPLPDDAAILIHGINDYEFDPAQHKLVSAASCTTTALAHMMRPLLERDLTKRHDHRRHEHRPRGDQLAAGARRRAQGRRHRPAQDAAAPSATSSSPRPTPPRRWSRSCRRSARIGFMADSVRIPTASVSLIILNVTFQSEALPGRHRLGRARRHQRHLPRGRRGRGRGPAQVQRRAERLRRHARRGRGRGHRGRGDAHAHRVHEPQRAAAHARRGRRRRRCACR